MEYLKAQLLSEATLKDEYVDVIERLRLEKEKLAASARKNLRDLQALKDDEISLLREEVRMLKIWKSNAFCFHNIFRHCRCKKQQPYLQKKFHN